MTKQKALKPITSHYYNISSIIDSLLIEFKTRLKQGQKVVHKNVS